jgi:hypothetical protein
MALSMQNVYLKERKQGAKYGTRETTIKNASYFYTIIFKTIQHKDLVYLNLM